MVANRQTFCKRYLTDYEPYCKRWVQLSAEEAKATMNLNMTFGYGYHDIISNKDMIEFHVDYWSQHQQEAAANNNANNIDRQVTPTTSIRISSRTRPLMIIGQDESVFAQYLLGSKTWVGPKGQRPLLPKSEGDGYMLSAFVAREFGFGKTWQ